VKCSENTRWAKDSCVPAKEGYCTVLEDGEVSYITQPPPTPHSRHIRPTAHSFSQTLSVLVNLLRGAGNFGEFWSAFGQNNFNTKNE
jgi:hypothetical protein